MTGGAMDLLPIVVRAAWAGLFAAGLSVLMTAPRGYVAVTYGFGFGSVFARDILVAAGVAPNSATLIAAAAMVAAAGRIVRKRAASPVVLISGLLPLGGAVAMFNVVFDLLRLSHAAPDMRSSLAVDLVSNLARVFAVSLSIALGIAVGMLASGMMRLDFMQAAEASD